jgi:hypothetical protein
MFENEIRNYADNLDALREYVDSLQPVLLEHIKSTMLENASELAPLLEVFARIIPNPPQELLKAASTWDHEITIEEQPESESDRNMRSFSIQLADPAKSIAFDSAMETLNRKDQHIQLLLRNSLITLVSSAEWFLSQVIHGYYQCFPERSEISDCTLTFRELSKFATIDDARKHLITRKIDDALRGSFNDWLEFLRKRLKLSMGYLKRDKDEIVESFQRRNVIVHNSGFVNSTYETNVSDSVKWNGPEEFPIQFHRSYLDSRINAFERTFILIAAELWKIVQPEDQNRDHVLWELSWKHLTEERWEVSEGLSYFGMNDGKMPESGRLVHRMNYWQCLKWQGRFAEIEKDVRSYDCSAKEAKFRVAKAALLDSEDEFFESAKEVIEREEITEEDLKNWPIFRKMRKLERFKEEFPDISE